MTALSMQDIFDTVANHLLTQGKQAKTQISGSCVYRDEDDNKCAVGCLILDEDYDKAMEGGTIRQQIRTALTGELETGCVTHVGSLLVVTALVKHGVNVYDEQVQDLLYRLQDTHDGSSYEMWQSDVLSKLEKIADDFGLVFVVTTTVTVNA